MSFRVYSAAQCCLGTFVGCRRFVEVASTKGDFLECDAGHPGSEFGLITRMPGKLFVLGSCICRVVVPSCRGSMVAGRE